MHIRTCTHRDSDSCRTQMEPGMTTGMTSLTELMKGVTRTRTTASLILQKKRRFFANAVDVGAAALAVAVNATVIVALQTPSAQGAIGKANAKSNSRVGSTQFNATLA